MSVLFLVSCGGSESDDVNANNDPQDNIDNVDNENIEILNDIEATYLEDLQAGRWTENGWSGGNFHGLDEAIVKEVMSSYANVPPPQVDSFPATNTETSCPYVSEDGSQDAICDYYWAHCPNELNTSFDNFGFDEVLCNDDSGLLDGYQRYYASSNTLSSVEFIASGESVGPVIRFGNTTNRGPKDRVIAKYFNYFGLEHGPYITFYEDHIDDFKYRVKQLSFFVYGEVQGNTVSFWPNGNIKSVVPYLNGECNGNVTEFFPNGELRFSAQCQDDNVSGDISLYKAIACKPGLGGFDFPALANFIDQDFIEHFFPVCTSKILNRMIYAPQWSSGIKVIISFTELKK
ncbi:hypothetical protein RT723_16745 [Psychrosphaera aquimarina]|uniref:Uncharacterized protein n=1 Tax=Psychrosphaera aquimarina TaxID=2044854 RepID=A0ABU3R4J5_9GAMM|nr:hypothetical protein [Psychrosphaera aquimarina]MDU0111989.1 hypothetical protein [Psychrosphaera aquimarina]MDU0114606.1 hypothetical protein [Psychrosphaera aquimarina]